MNLPANNLKLFGLPAQTGRWFLIFLGLIVMLCIGTAYSWSIFVIPIEETLNVGATESLLPFTILLIVCSLVMPIAGFYIERFGSRRMMTIGALVLGMGYTTSGLVNSIPALVFTYGAIAGTGVGILYGVPLAVAAKWFPDRQGIAVSITVIGFGMSPLVTAPLARASITAFNSNGWQTTLMIFGISFTVIILAIASVMKYPDADWQPEGKIRTVDRRSSISRTNGSILKIKSFWGLWLSFLIGTFAGLSALGTASPIAQEIIGLDSAAAAWTVSLFAIPNAIGRVFFGWFAERFTPKNAAIFGYVLVIIASIMMLDVGAGNLITYLIAFSLMVFSSGGWAAIAPTATLLLFPAEDYAKNYGFVFTGWGTGALLGTLGAGAMRDLFGTFSYFFYVTGGLAILGILVAVFLLKRSLVSQ
jgi:MFS transporter, OFA family, oxalate/formate antiporter